MRKRRRGTKFFLSESVYGLLFGAIMFVIALLISEFGVWVFTQWLFPRDMLFRIFLILNIAVSGIMVFVPLYNKRFIQAIVAVSFILAIWLLLFKVFDFHPVETLLSFL